MTHLPVDQLESNVERVSDPTPRIKLVLSEIWKTILSGIFVLWAAVTATFVAIQIAPGDTVSVLLGENRDDPALRQQAIERWGLDQPVWSQYLLYLKRIPQGDFGISYNLRKPVSELLLEAIGPTIQLTIAAALGAILIAVLVTLVTSVNSKFVRGFSSLMELILISTPSFWLGIVLLYLVSFRLGWFSVIEVGSWQALVLPAASLAIPIGAYLSQILREGIDKAMEQPFALTARTRGLSKPAVRFRHGFRHGGLPALNILGLIIGGLLGGAVIIEQVFGRPGIGQIAVDAVTVKDVPLILGVTIVSTAAFVLVSTIVEIVSTVIDPRSTRKQLV